MYNYLSFDEPVQQQLFPNIPLNPPNIAFRANSTNKFVYIKQNFSYNSTEQDPVKVLLNPNFNKKVFVNPNFSGNIKNITPTNSFPKIHVNPNIQNLKLGTDECRSINKIHVNPHVLRNVPIPIKSAENAVTGENCNKTITRCVPKKEVNCTIISTRTKLVRATAKDVPEIKIRKRRLSIRSQYKIIKSSVLETSCNGNGTKSKYRLIKLSNKYPQGSKNTKSVTNKFKLDNRSIKKMETSPKNKIYVYVNRFLNISDIARSNLLKHNKNKCAVNIDGVLYRKSPHSLKRTSNLYNKTNNVKRVQENAINKSKYKLSRKSQNVSVLNINNQGLKLSKCPMLKRKNIGKNTSKLRVCNIPCPYYRKFGKCKGKENGKCCRKHDPDQIALCTKFLQGACVDKKCLLSHNVSPEKMPTCKFYLEGSCSREDCPYVHVRISPKADVCKDFLEGFCKKAAECEKRHQFLCPDYEKNGNCLKQRCPYPHGKMVRKYSVFNKNKFAKKSSKNCTTKVEIDNTTVHTKSENLITTEGYEGKSEKPRYYIGQNDLYNEERDGISNSNQNIFDSIDKKSDQGCGIKCRPKLGKLPSFIAFENI